MLENSKKIPFIKGNGIIKPLIFDPEDKKENETFKIVDDNVLLNVEPGRYLVSDMGRVYDTKLNVYKNPVPNGNPETTHRQPYYKTKFNYSISNDSNYQQKDMYFHRIVAKAFMPDENSEYLDVDHLNGNHGDNSLKNLEWVDNKENRRRAVEKDYVLSCENHPHSLFTNDQVHQICKLLSEGYPVSEIARRFNVTPAVIQNIKGKRNYNRISMQYDIPETINNKNSKLPDEMVHKICQMLVDGKGITDICKTLNVGRHIVNDIKSKRNYTKISDLYDFERPKENRILNQKEVRKICEKLQNGENISDISREMGISTATITNIKHRKIHQYISLEYNFDKSNSKYINDDKLITICSLIEKGNSNTEIYEDVGKRLGVSLAVISNIRNHKSGNHISKNFNF